MAGFKILVSAGKNDDGQDLYVLMGETEATSRAEAVGKALSDNGVDVRPGDNVAAIKAKEFDPQPLVLTTAPKPRKPRSPNKAKTAA